MTQSNVRLMQSRGHSILAIYSGARIYIAESYGFGRAPECYLSGCISLTRPAHVMSAEQHNIMRGVHMDSNEPKQPEQPHIYDAMKAAGVQIDNHYSDLYVPVNDTTRAIIAQYPDARPRTFTSQIDGKPWFELTFAYLPYWEQRTAEKRAAAEGSATNATNNTEERS